VFRCHGCGVGGDVFTFVREQAKCSFADAVRLLSQRAGIAVEGFQPSAELSAKVAAIKKERDEEERFERFCNERLDAIGRKYRSLGRAATHAENYLVSGGNDPHIEERAWGAVKRYRDYEARVEREELCDSNVLREEWVRGSYVAA
jgi:DNA primase